MLFLIRTEIRGAPHFLVAYTEVGDLYTLNLGQAWVFRTKADAEAMVMEIESRRSGPLRGRALCIIEDDRPQPAIPPDWSVREIGEREFWMREPGGDDDECS